MDLKDKPRFLDALEVVQEVCCDLMEDTRQRAYWVVLGPRCTIEEWELCVLDVLATTTFHRVPTPGVFMEAIDARRHDDRQREARARQQGAEQARRDEDALARRMLVGPHDGSAEDAAMRECMRQLDRILGSGWRTLAEHQGAGFTRTNARRRPTAVVATTPEEA